MRRRKQVRGQSILEFISLAPFLVMTFFFILATAVVWMQNTMAQRLAFEGARQSCAGVAYGGQTMSDWSRSWPSAPGSYTRQCENGLCVYSVSSNYFISWLTGLFSSHSSVSIRGQAACPDGEFHSPKEDLRNP